MKVWLPLLILLVGCAHKPPTVDFLYKGMSKELMLNLMGEPLQIITTYQGRDPAKQYQFSNSQCENGRKAVCTVSVTESGIVYEWKGVRKALTEDGQK